MGPRAPAADLFRTAGAIGSVLFAAGAALLAVPPSGTADARPGSFVAPVRVAAFFYPWWGTPGADGRWLHWGQRGARPPIRIASGFWPARGLYSSGDRLVLNAQMRELRAADVDQVVTSWWGRGS